MKGDGKENETFCFLARAAAENKVRSRDGERSSFRRKWLRVARKTGSKDTAGS